MKTQKYTVNPKQKNRPWTKEEIDSQLGPGIMLVHTGLGRRERRAAKRKKGKGERPQEAAHKKYNEAAR